jgi:hypothetical protein
MMKMMWVGPGAHMLHLLHLPSIAVLFAGSADDIGNEAVELKALLEAGYTKQELLRRMRVLIPVFAGATAASFGVEHLVQAGSVGEAGLLFGGTAVALSLTSSLQSMAMYKAGYNELLREGKIPGKAKHLAGDPQFQATLKEMERTSRLISEAGKPELLALVRRHLDGLGDQMSIEEKTATLDALEKLDFKALQKQVRDPSLIQRWKEGIKQDFANPVRVGILTGTVLAPFVAYVAAKGGALNNGFAMAVVGSTESIIGGIMVKLSHRMNDYKMHVALKNKLSALASN